MLPIEILYSYIVYYSSAISISFRGLREESGITILVGFICCSLGGSNIFNNSDLLYCKKTSLS
jgi:hypothetical protein